MVFIFRVHVSPKFFSKDGKTTLSLPNPPLMWISSPRRLKVIVRSCCSCYVKPVQLDPGIVAASRVDVKIRFIVGYLGLGPRNHTKMVGEEDETWETYIKTNFIFRANGKTYLANGKTLNFLGLHIQEGKISCSNFLFQGPLAQVRQ